MKLQIDLSQSGLAMVFRSYQREVMKMIWSAPKGSEGYSSRDVWKYINKQWVPDPEQGDEDFSRRDSISRASIINFLNDMVDENFLNFYEATGKGGHRRIYSAKLDEKQFWTKIIEVTTEKLEEASGCRVSIYTPAPRILP